MASKAFHVLKTLSRQFLKLRRWRFQQKHDAPVIPSKPITRVVQKAQTQRTIWELGRYLLRVPRLFRCGPITPIRLGLCIGLAIKQNDSVEFREIRDVANTCLKSSISQGGAWEFSSLQQLELGHYLNKGCQGAIYSVRPVDDRPLVAAEEFPMVMKMLFNYQEDGLPRYQLDEDVAETFKAETVPLSFLPPHPSIARIHGAVVERIPELPDAESQFPSALPPSLYPDLRDICVGGEKTLFLLMQRYSTSLSEKLAEGALSVEETIQVLLQLLEGDIFIKKHGIAHRDMHAKNVLLDVCEDGSLKACITDFGCATDKLTRRSPQCLRLNTPPGIPSLQAPEVANIDSSTSLDYRKADLWAIATLMHEMRCPGRNPFRANGGLDSRNYREDDIPSVPGLPDWLDLLVREMLTRDPRHRPSSEFCANVVHMMRMQIPTSWIVGNEPTRQQIHEWILMKMVGLIMNHRRSHTNLCHLIFCKRITERDFRRALTWLRRTIV